jgi:uncharacterized protein
LTQAWLYSACGFIVGLLVGLTGVGGGSLMTPLLILGFGQSPAVAVGTDLLFSGATKLAGTTSYAASHRVDWRIVSRLALGSLPGALAILLVLAKTAPASAATQGLISHGLAVLLIVSATGLIWSARAKVAGRAAWQISERYLPYQGALTILVGILLGVGVTLTSVGAGALGIVALTSLYGDRSLDRLVATDVAHALFLTSIAAAGHAFLGHIDLAAVAWLLVGSVHGVILATRTAPHLPPRAARGLIAALLTVVSARLLLV